VKSIPGIEHIRAQAIAEPNAENKGRRLRGCRKFVVLKGRGFSRAARVGISILVLATEGIFPRQVCYYPSKPLKIKGLSPGKGDPGHHFGI
jgi:hypothetical protein